VTEDSRPVPDPTTLTTEQLDREIAHAKELTDLHFQLIESQRLESKADAETRRLESKIDNQRELQTALVAAKESVQSFRDAYDVAHTAMMVSIDALRQRVTILDATALGASTNRIDERKGRAESRDNLALWIAIAGIFVACSGVALTIVLTIANAWLVHVGH
jgi:multidrug resistance efflux pump